MYFCTSYVRNVAQVLYCPEQSPMATVAPARNIMGGRLHGGSTDVSTVSEQVPTSNPKLPVTKKTHTTALPVHFFLASMWCSNIIIKVWKHEIGFMLASFPDSVQDSESEFSNQGTYLAITAVSVYILLAFIAVAVCGNLVYT